MSENGPEGSQVCGALCAVSKSGVCLMSGEVGIPMLTHVLPTLISSALFPRLFKSSSPLHTSCRGTKGMVPREDIFTIALPFPTKI